MFHRSCFSSKKARLSFPAENNKGKAGGFWLNPHGLGNFWLGVERNFVLDCV
jgi:hypothetical protein